MRRRAHREPVKPSNEADRYLRVKTERFIPQQATYTAKEAAAYLKVSERQIRNFIARKLLRKSKAQAKTLIPGEDVETLLARTS